MSSTVAAPLKQPRTRPRPFGGLSLRLRVHRRALALDRALAGGASPLESEELTLRADQLSQPATRKRFARLVARLTDPTQSQVGLLPYSYNRVRANREQLVGIGEALAAPGPLPVRGAAMLSVLLDDARGPLYAHDLPADLGTPLKHTLAALQA
jgi:hypothetical protein